MNHFISVIIPNRNGGRTIEECLKALFSSDYSEFEVTVADDCSTDNSSDIISQFPCRLLKLEKHSGAAAARNTGAKESSGEILFFIDADCVVKENTLSMVSTAYKKNRNCVTGGTYTPLAFDDTFYSTFQSIFINYSELKKNKPDYVATHSMVIGRELFLKSGGFPEDFMPILEDVAFSHRIRASGTELKMDPDIIVRHIFYFTLSKSLKNAFRKSKYWTAYSLKNRAVLSDSGTASTELKFNVLSAFFIWFFLICFIAVPDTFFIACMAIFLAFNLVISRTLFKAFFATKGWLFGLKAVIYYSLIYPFGVAAGAAAGIIYHLRTNKEI